MFLDRRTFAAAFLVSPYVSVALYVAVAVTWLIPDRRFERPRDLQR